MSLLTLAEKHGPKEALLGNPWQPMATQNLRNRTLKQLQPSRQSTLRARHVPITRTAESSPLTAQSLEPCIGEAWRSFTVTVTGTVVTL